MSEMRLPLEVTRWKNPCVRGPLAMWRDAEPFVRNERGLLIHRPRFVNVYRHPTKGYPFIAVRYYCGNCVTGTDKYLRFTSDLNESDLMCVVCETRAQMAGLPAASEIAGRHVHIGKLKAIQMCCTDHERFPLEMPAFLRRDTP